MTYAERIESKVRAGLAPTIFELTDESHQHAGHAGANPSGETHFRLRVVSERFWGLGLVERHRLVYGLLSEEMRERVHALTLQTLTPDELTP